MQVATILTILAARATAATWDTEITPRAGDNFTEAKFRLRLDASGRFVKGLLVLSTGWNGDGRGLVDDAGWRQLAKQAGFGIVGVCFRSSDNETAPLYHTVDQGSGEAFKRALAELAKTSRHPEVAKAPLLAWGHSAGGEFSYGLACFMPERVIAFAAVKGGVYKTRFNPLALKIPGIFIIGEQDEPVRLLTITQIFEAVVRPGRCGAWPGKRAQAMKSAAVGKSFEPFFRDALALRMSGAGPLAPVAAGRGWLGSRATLALTPPGSSVAQNLIGTVWLPGEPSSKAWAEFAR